MSAFSDLLESFDDRPSIPELRAMALESHGVDILGVYDFHTGRKIGLLDEDELQFAIEEEACDSFEELIDGLVVRVVCAMRPSPAFNKPDRLTIRNMVGKRPHDALAYLLNRLYHPLALKRDFSDTFDAYKGRIQMYSFVQKLDPSLILELTHWMLEMDSRFNLTLHSHLAVTMPLESLIAKPAEFSGLVMKYLCRNDEPYTGNRLTQVAYLQSHLDNPEIAARKIELMKRPLRESFTKPRAASSKKISKLQTRVDQFIGLLDGILKDDTAASPGPSVPVTRKVMTGGQFNFARKAKES